MRSQSKNEGFAGFAASLLSSTCSHPSSVTCPSFSLSFTLCPSPPYPFLCFSLCLSVFLSSPPHTSFSLASLAVSLSLPSLSVSFLPISLFLVLSLSPLLSLLPKVFLSRFALGPLSPLCFPRCSKHLRSPHPASFAAFSDRSSQQLFLQ